RVRFGATSLIGRELYIVYTEVLKFFMDMGFSVRKETLSRVDLQVLINEPIQSFIDLIYSGHAISRARIDKLQRKSGQVETFTVGSGGRLELCIYDKVKELQKSMINDPVKFELMLRYCIGENYFNGSVTRVEFRLWRDALRAIGINTVGDLYDRQKMLVKWLTHDWFRILDKPKVRGHENSAAIHPLWQKVCDLFERWFPLPSHLDSSSCRPIVFNRSESISCNVDMLKQQAFGCLAKAAAYEFGQQDDIADIYSILKIYVGESGKKLVGKVNDNAKRIEIMKGVLLDDVDGKLSSSKEVKSPSYCESDKLETPSGCFCK
ncbi:MAG: hypothetical protein LBQ66_00765, partial [Planctomycetaceae bacterium]|nr:hypothetical protein [Planctomycetaceae bacterium]